MVDVCYSTTSVHYSITVRPNCSLSPAGIFCALPSMSLMSLPIGRDVRLDVPCADQTPRGGRIPRRHVILGRILAGHFTANHHLAFEAVSLCRDFVVVVWLLLFVFVYWL